MTDFMLRARTARVLALPAILALAMWGCAQSPTPTLSHGGDPLASPNPVPGQPEVTAQIPSGPLAQQAQISPASETAPAARPSRSRKQQGPEGKGSTATAPKQELPRDDLRFLKSLPPKPAVQPPYPSIATPPIETNPAIPLLTEAEQKKMEEDLQKLAKGQAEPRKKQPAKKQSARQPASQPKKDTGTAPLKIN